MPTRRRSLATVVAATLVVVTTALLGTYSIVSYRSDAKHQWNALRGLTMVQADELSVAIELPIWNIDRAQINRVIDPMSRPQSVYGISVVADGETYGRVRDSKWRLVPWNGKPEPGDMFVEKRSIVFSGNEIGTVRLLVTPEFTRKYLRETLLRIVSTIVAVEVLLLLFTSLLSLRARGGPL